MNLFAKIALLALTVVFGVLAAQSINRNNGVEYVINIQNHRFSPEKLAIPANQKATLIIKNLDKTVEEFESLDLRREKLVPGQGEIRMPLPPLKPGIYSYFGEFHPQTANGIIEVKEGIEEGQKE